AILAITGFCFAAFLVQLVVRFRGQGGSIHDFVNRNQLEAHARMQVLGWLGAGAAGGAITALAQYFWRFSRRSPVARAIRVLRTARLSCPLMLPGVAWPLVVATEWDALSRIIGIVLVALLAEMCFRDAAGELISGSVAPGRPLSRRFISLE